MRKKELTTRQRIRLLKEFLSNTKGLNKAIIESYKNQLVEQEKEFDDDKKKLISVVVPKRICSA